MKKTMNYMLLAVLMLGMGSTLISCTDDELTEDEKETQFQKEVDPNEKMGEAASALYPLLSQLCGVSEMPDNWQTQIFEAVVGYVENEAQPSVRTITVQDFDEAREHFASLVNRDLKTFDIGAFTWKYDGVGTLDFEQGGDGVAHVDVNIRQIPGLKRLVYKTIEQSNNNGSFSGTAYYSLGDVIESNADGSVWVCVRPANNTYGKTDSHWISLSYSDKCIYSYTKKGYDYHLPTGLGCSKEHLQNFATLLWCLDVYRKAEILKDEKSQKEANSMQHTINILMPKGIGKLGSFYDAKYLETVALAWGDDKAYDDDPYDSDEEVVTKPNIWRKIFSSLPEFMKNFGLAFYYEGKWEYSKYFQLHHVAYSGDLAMTANDTYPKFMFDANNNKNYDIRTFWEDKNYWRELELFNVTIPQNPGLVARYKTGKELDKSYSPTKALNGFTEIYRYTKEHPAVETKRYYPGDIIRTKDGHSYVCISEHEFNTDATFITLGVNPGTGTNGWATVGDDKVVNGQMSEPQDVYAYVKTVYNDRGPRQYIMSSLNAMERVGHISENEKKDILHDTGYGTESTRFYAANGQNASFGSYLLTEANENPQYIVGSRNYEWENIWDYKDNGSIRTAWPSYSLMLTKTHRWSSGIFNFDYWVPYISFLLADHAYATNTIAEMLNEREYQNCSHFQWEYLGKMDVSLISKDDEDDEGKEGFDNLSFLVYLLAIHWQHNMWNNKYHVYDLTKNVLTPTTLTLKDAGLRPKDVTDIVLRKYRKYQ